MPQCQGPQYTGTTKRTPQGERGRKMPFCQGAQYYKKGTTWRRGQVGPYYTTKRALQGEIHLPVRCLGILQNGHYGVRAPTKISFCQGPQYVQEEELGAVRDRYWGTISSTGVQEVVLVANDMPHRKNSLNKSLLFFSRFARTVFNA